MTLGQHLKSRRQELGRSLEQLAALTKIHIKILSAIEEDRYSDLPARTFTRGFIVNYTKALRLDPEQMLSSYHDFLEQKFSERPNRDQGHQGYAFEGKELEQNRRWMAVGGSLAAVFAIAVLLIFKPENHKRKEKHKDFETEVGEAALEPAVPLAAAPAVPTGNSVPSISIANLSEDHGINSSENTLSKSSSGFHLPEKPLVLAPSSTPAPSPKPVASPKPAASATPAPSSTPAESDVKPDPLHKGDHLSPTEAKRKITFQAKEDIWVRYKSDDLPANTLILRKGRFLVIKAKEKILVESNHPENLQYRILSGPKKDLTLPKGELDSSTELKAYSGTELGAQALPDSVPQPKGQ